MHAIPNIQQQARSAIEDLAGRYGKLIYGAALRQLCDAAAAEDVTQAVFLVALRRGRDLPEESRMAGWLLKMTHYAVRSSRRSAARRAYHERHAAARRGRASGPDFPEELRVSLDEGLLALGALDREVVVRRYLQGQRVDEIASRVGLTENAVSKRLGRALEKLQAWFRRRGMAASPAVVAGVLTKEASVQLPGPALSMFASMQPAGISGLRARDVFWRMVMVKVQAAALGCVALVLLVAVGAGVWMLKGAFRASQAVALSDWDRPYSPTVTSVVQESSDALLQEVLAKLEENRQKLKTLHIKGARRVQVVDPRSKQWIDMGEVSKGEAWIDLRAGDRERFELEFWKSIVLENKQAVGSSSATCVWDGKQTQWLLSNVSAEAPKLLVLDVREFPEEAFTNSGMSIALWRSQGYLGGDLVAGGYVLSPKSLHDPALKIAARRVMLDGRDPAVELELRFSIAARYFKRYWFDETKGFSLKARQEGEEGKPLMNQWVVDQLQETSQGLYYPVKVRGCSVDEVVRMRWSVELTQVTTNEPIPDERFVLNVPPGVKVTHSPLHYASAASQPGAITGAATQP